MSVAALLDPVLTTLLRVFVRRPREPEGVLLVTGRGPAEMVFLTAVLPRFTRLAGEGEAIALLCRTDSAGMSFLFPRRLAVKKLDWRRLGGLAARWQVFRRLYRQHWRLVVSLDQRRDPDDVALIAACAAPEAAAMRRGPQDEPAPPFTWMVDVGSARQDKILRWSRYADELLDDRQPPELAQLDPDRLPVPAKLPPTAVLMPFSGVRRRQLPMDFWRQLIAAIPSGWEVRIAGHPSDFARNPDYQALFKLPHVVAETHGFEMLSAILRGSRMVIGVDTAAFHLAVLLGVPALCLASAAFVSAGVPYDEAVTPANVRFFFTPMACQGCLGHCKLEPVGGMYPCVAAIDPEAVTEAVRDAIARGAM